VGPKSLVSGIEDIQLEDNIIFKGVLKGSDLWMLTKWRMFCLPTLEEGMALQGKHRHLVAPHNNYFQFGGDELITDGKEGFI
jgi:hypothetical protein